MNLAFEIDLLRKQYDKDVSKRLKKLDRDARKLTDLALMYGIPGKGKTEAFKKAPTRRGKKP